jgi:hypothetical protein
VAERPLRCRCGGRGASPLRGGIATAVGKFALAAKQLAPTSGHPLRILLPASAGIFGMSCEYAEAMDDVVALALQLESGDEAFVITWGRLYHAVDTLPLAHAVLKQRQQFQLQSPVTGVRLCESLREAALAPRFFECLLAVGRERIPFGPDYASWRRRKLAMVESGRDLWFAGVAEADERQEPHLSLSDAYVPPEWRHEPPPPFDSPVSEEPTHWATDILECHVWVWSGTGWEPTAYEATNAGDERHSRHRMAAVDDHHIACEDCGLTVTVSPSDSPDP